MKKFLLFTAVLFIMGSSLHAQLPDVKKASQDVNAMAAPGKLLSQFADGIKPASFLSNWSGEKIGWLNNAGKISSAIGMAQSLSSLIGFLKPESFKSGFNIQSLLKTANTVKTMSGAAGLLKSLEGGLKPESLSDSWGEQRSGWLNALNVMK